MRLKKQSNDQVRHAFDGIRKKRKTKEEPTLQNTTDPITTFATDKQKDGQPDENTVKTEQNDEQPDENTVKAEQKDRHFIKAKKKDKPKKSNSIKAKQSDKTSGKVEQMSVDDTGRKVVIEVKDLYKIYKVGSTKVRALNGVDFKVYEGEFCAIVGTSGSGKSTLLNMLAGLEKPTKGEIIIAGHHIEKMSENKLVRFRQKNVGFIFQSFNLLGTMNAIENVALPLSFRGISKQVRLKKAKKMLKLVGLSQHALHRPNQMSGGQQQRVGMARALVVNPKIMFADEPTGNLDSKTSKEMMNLMRKIVNEQKKTLVMVTHDDSLAAIADKVIRIVDGKIVQIEDRSTEIMEDNKHETIE